MNASPNKPLVPTRKATRDTSMALTGMKNLEYHVSVTTFEPALKTERRIFKDWPLAANAAGQVAGLDVVFVVEALGDGVDFGNFYLFANAQSMAHVVLHEHCEFCLVERSREHIAGTIGFKDEDGSAYSVGANRAMSLARGQSGFRVLVARPNAI